MPGSGGTRAAETDPDPLEVAAAIVWLGGQIIVQRRPQNAGHGAGALELPGGKLEAGETPALALARELVEEWGPAARDLKVGEPVTVVRHRYPPPGPSLRLWVLRVDAGAWPREGWARRLVLQAGARVLAFEPAQLPIERFLAADRPVVDALRRGVDP